MKATLVTLLFVAMFSLVGYKIYDDEKNKPSPEQQKINQAHNVVSEVNTMCVKGVLYYYTSGAHSARMAPAIDNITLQFIRCK